MEPDRASPGYMTACAPIPRRDDIRVLARTARGETVALPAAALPPSMRTSRTRCTAASGALTITKWGSSTTATGTAWTGS